MPSEISVNDFLTPFAIIDREKPIWNIIDYASVVGLRLHTLVAGSLPQYTIVPAIDPSLEPWFLISLSRRGESGKRRIPGPVILTNGDGYAPCFYSEKNAGGRSTITLRRPAPSGKFNNISLDQEIIIEAIRGIADLDDAPLVFGDSR